jgi:hypothetical protein
LYGEKIVPLIDYILSTDFPESDKMATAFYNIVNKYKNTNLLPLDKINAIIDESGYGYVRDLLGDNEESIRLLISLLVLIHQLKGSKMGIEVVLNLLKRDNNTIIMNLVGDVILSRNNIASGFALDSYIAYNNFTTDNERFEITLQIRTGDIGEEQCICSVLDHRLRLLIDSQGRLSLSLGNNGTSWNLVHNAKSSATLAPNTNYYITISYSGYSYEVRISTDSRKYTSFISASIDQPLNILGSIFYIGIDKSEGVLREPFKGTINLGPLNINVENITIEEWFETLPVGIEDTFMVKADLDVTLVSSGFFSKFANFVRKYVYPSLTAFEATLNFQAYLTFLPYIRERIEYVALCDMVGRENFHVKIEEGWNETLDHEEGWDPFLPKPKDWKPGDPENVGVPYLVVVETQD